MHTAANSEVPMVWKHSSTMIVDGFYTSLYGEAKPRETGGIAVEYVNRRRRGCG